MYITCLSLSIYFAIFYQYGLSIDVFMDTITTVYMSPFYRFTPYFWGTVGALFFNAYKEQLKGMSIHTEKVIWYVTLSLIIVIIFMEFDRSLPTIPSICISIFGQHANAFFVCWIMIASCLQKKTWWLKVLEWRIFQHFSKISFETYLVSPIVINLMFSLCDNGVNFDLPLIVSCFFCTNKIFEFESHLCRLSFALDSSS